MFRVRFCTPHHQGRSSVTVGRGLGGGGRLPYPPPSLFLTSPSCMQTTPHPQSLLSIRRDENYDSNRFCRRDSDRGLSAHVARRTKTIRSCVFSRLLPPRCLSFGEKAARAAKSPIFSARRLPSPVKSLNDRNHVHVERRSLIMAHRLRACVCRRLNRHRCGSA